MPLTIGPLDTSLLNRTVNTTDTLEQLRLPLHNLIRMHVELLWQLRQCSVAFKRRRRKLHLECRGMVPSWRFLFSAPIAGSFFAFQSRTFT